MLRVSSWAQNKDAPAVLFCTLPVGPGGVASAAQVEGDPVLIVGAFELAGFAGGGDVEGFVHVGGIDDQAHGNPGVGMVGLVQGVFLLIDRERVPLF